MSVPKLCLPYICTPADEAPGLYSRAEQLAYSGTYKRHQRGAHKCLKLLASFSGKIDVNSK
jgi:hypothetical protein